MRKVFPRRDSRDESSQAHPGGSGVCCYKRDARGSAALCRGVCTSECQCGRMFYIARSELQREREREEGGAHYRLLRSNFSFNIVGG